MNLVAKLKNSKNLIDIQKDININSQNQSYLIEITTTNQCNCNCKYCFETDHSKKYFSSEEQERQLNLIIDFCDKDYIRHYKKVSIVFWGGEPMLNLDYIKNIIYATKKYKFVTYFMYSSFYQLIPNSNLSLPRPLSPVVTIGFKVCESLSINVFICIIFQIPHTCDII